MSAYYNEIDPFAADWLRELIRAGHIAPGEVDTRSIEDVAPDDLTGFAQCHFFAGIGTWSYALRRAGWADDRPVWTGSCPCQPFSAAGKRKGTADERHLWPAFFHLIGQCRPVTVFGEQVASCDGLAWFDLVSSDLEGTGYAVGAVDTCAAGFGAPHIRQRLYWVAHAEVCGSGTFYGESGAGVRQEVAAGGYGFSDGVAHADGKQLHRRRFPKERGGAELADGGGTVGLADAPGKQKYEEQQQSAKTEGERDADMPCGRGMACGLADAMPAGWPSRGADAGNGQTAGRRVSGGLGDAGDSRNDTAAQGWKEQDRPASATGVSDAPLPTDGFWRDADWLLCRDGRWRPVEPGTFPLAHGAAGRVGRLCGYGNAIVAPQAEAFIRAFDELTEEQRWMRPR